MTPNPVLKKLGLSDNDRVVIFHADDIGLCHASVAAYTELVDFGLVSSASVMVPCPWFPETAAFCREHRDKTDMGVHITLTSEWTGYRWGPISTRDPASGLIDETGYFYPRCEDVSEHGDPAAVRCEIQAQVQRALYAGIDVTHIDDHMGCAGHPKFWAGYMQTALQHQLLSYGTWFVQNDLGTDPTPSSPERGYSEVALFDNVIGGGPGEDGNLLEYVKGILSALPSGITQIIIHPALDTPELRAITPWWRDRVASYQTFMSEALRAYVQDLGIHVIGFRALRDLMRDGV